MNNSDIGTLVIIILLLIGFLFLLSYLRKKFKSLNLPCVFFVSGEVKSGKSLLSVHLAIKEYKRALFKWRVKKVLRLLFMPFKFKDKYAKVEQYMMNQEFDNFPYFDIDLDLKDYLPPMLYSNIPLAMVKFNMLTIDILKREVRIPNKSIILIDEVSLLADSQLFKDTEINNDLMAFYKLAGHSTHGGKVIIDSQSVLDNHYSIKRCMGSYLYIHERTKLPFITIMKVRQLMYANDGSVVNNFNEDIELSMRKIIIFNSTYDKYDCYCYSVFTDYLPVKVRYNVDIKSKKDDLKCYNIVSLNDFVKQINESIKGKYPNTTIDGDIEGVVENESED